MLKHTAYLLCGKTLLSCIEQNEQMRLDAEMINSFLIGMLIPQDQNKNITDEVDKIKIKKASSFELGCKFRRFLDQSNNLAKLSKGISNNEALIKSAKLWKKYRLCLPECAMFLSPLKSVSAFSYLPVYDEICLKLAEMKKESCTAGKACSVSEIEECCGTEAEKFYRDHVRRKWKCKNKKKITKKQKNSEKKWSADAVKMQYYEDCWHEICSRAEFDDKTDPDLELFFAGLKKEIENVSTRSSTMLTNRNEEQKKIIVYSLKATIFNAAATGLTVISDSIVDDTNFPEPVKIFTKAVPITLSIIATACTAFFTAYNLMKEHNAYEETWLRHQLHFSRLTGEMEKFCEGIGEYEGVYQDKDSAKKAINCFQKNIYLLRKQDYANFFTNMNCINYDSVFKLDNVEFTANKSPEKCVAAEQESGEA